MKYAGAMEDEMSTPNSKMDFSELPGESPNVQQEMFGKLARETPGRQSDSKRLE